MMPQPDFITDMIVVFGCVWLAMTPLVMASALLEFLDRRRRGQKIRALGDWWRR